MSKRNHSKVFLARCELATRFSFLEAELPEECGHTKPFLMFVTHVTNHAPHFAEFTDEWRRWLREGEVFEMQWYDDSTGRKTEGWFNRSCWRRYNGNKMPKRVRPWIRRQVGGEWEPYVYAPW